VDGDLAGSRQAVRERRSFELELRELAGAKASERSRPKQEDSTKPGVRKLILAAGIDYPRYDAEKAPDPEPRGWKPKWWKLRANSRGPQRLRDAWNGSLGPAGCITPAERKLKSVPPEVLSGSYSRIRCLRIAVHELSADPTLQVYLYDFDKGVEERVTIEKDKLKTQVIRRFLPTADADYRLEVSVEVDLGGGKRGTKQVLKPITDLKLPYLDPKDPPKVRYYPFASRIDAGDVDRAEWEKRYGTNATFLTSYERLPEAKRFLSVTDVYYHVAFIGKNKPYVLQGLHLVAHASSSALSPLSGPAFANTDHLPIPSRKGRRNPLDFDARAGLDFEAANLDRTAFRMAFAKGALGHVWGCNWSRPLVDILRQARDVLKGKELKDTTALVFRFRKGRGGKEAHFRRLLQIPDGEKTDKVVRDGKFLRELGRRVLEDTYMQRLADAAARCVAGGLPATYSNYDQKSELRSPCVLHIPMGKLYGTSGVDFRPDLAFFARYFGVSFLKDGANPKYGRGYALYCPRP
jgi:hypothetical protein